MRKTVGLIVVFASIMLVVPSSAYSPPPVTDGLVGCWNFEEGNGVTAFDTSGNGNDGLIVNATYSTDTHSQALSAYSLRFNNTYGAYAYSYVTIPDSASLDSSSGMTIAAWVKQDPVEGRAVVISKPYGISVLEQNQKSYLLYYEGSDLGVVLGAFIGMPAPPANEWHHIVATYNGSFTWIYVDGKQEAGYPSTQPIVYDNNSLLIGADINNDARIPDQGWNGLIDDVLIYTRSLTQAEIAQIFSASTPRTVGVTVGNMFNHTVAFSWSSTDPNATVSPYFSSLNETEWISTSIVGVSGTGVTLEMAMHFKNGTDSVQTGITDVTTGDGNVTNWVVAADLNPNDTIYTSGMYSSWAINETIVRNYPGGVRDTNHLNMSTETNMSGVYQYYSMNFYWDKTTGVMVEMSMAMITQANASQTDLSATVKIASSDIWLVPEFPTLILSLVALVLLATAFSYRKRRLSKQPIC